MSEPVSTIVAVLLLGQATLVMPPSPPPADDYASIAGPLKRACMSDAGVALVVKNRLEERQENQADISNFRAIYQQVGDAAHADPIDVVRLGRALQVQIDYQHSRSEERNRRSIRILEHLSAPDRAIYARTLSTLKSNVPQKVCPTH